MSSTPPLSRNNDSTKSVNTSKSVESKGKYGEPDEDSIHRSSMIPPRTKFPSDARNQKSATATTTMTSVDAIYSPNLSDEIWFDEYNAKQASNSNADALLNTNVDEDEIEVHLSNRPEAATSASFTSLPRPISPKRRILSLPQRVVNKLPFVHRRHSTEEANRRHYGDYDDNGIHVSGRTRVSFKGEPKPNDEQSVEMKLFQTSLIERLVNNESFFDSLRSDQSDGGGISNSNRSSQLSSSSSMPSSNQSRQGLGKIGTYEAVKKYIQEFEARGGRSIEFIPKFELEIIVTIFEERGIDLSDVTNFPYDAPDLSKCIRLLAKIQNSVAMEGVTGLVCTVKHMTEDVLLDRNKKAHRYDIGEWVEVRGPSMVWRLELIEDILRTKDEDGNTVYWYETGVDHKLAEHEVRLPREALRRVFGIGPWIWQQWAALRLENKLRFQEGHQDDFEVLDICDFVYELWKCWLFDSRNKDFRMLFERVGESGQEELIVHIMGPFKLMEEIITNRDDQWNLDDADISLFTYVSLLGSGFVDAFIIFLLQLAIPAILLVFYSSPARDDDGIALGTRAMLFVILFYYLFKVTRDMYAQLKHTVGIYDTVYSRILSLRTRVWLCGNDSFPQSIGYVGDIFMNTGYTCILYLFNMFILYNIGDTFEMMGSVIIFEFVYNLDEELAATLWLDPQKRFLRAGVIENIFQLYIRRERFQSRATYMDQWCALYSDDERKFIERLMDGADIPRGRKFLSGSEPNSDIGILTIGEQIDRLRREDSQRVSQKGYDNDYDVMPEAHFGSFWDSDNAVFTRHKHCNAWSQWEELIFMFPTPKLVPPNYLAGSKLVLEDELGNTLARRGQGFSSDGFSSGTSRNQRFWAHVKEVLQLKYAARGYQNAFNFERGQKFSHIVTRTLHAIFAWTAYVVVIVVFPILSMLALIFVWTPIYCVFHLGTCETEL